MHRSRFAGFIIDCNTDSLGVAAEFWSKAFGYAIATEQGGGPYLELDAPPDQPYVEVQQVSHESRVHLDIESDDLDAEAARLEALGARRVAKVKRWIVMEAPTGQRFCIVPPVSKRFAETANTWGND